MKKNLIILVLIFAITKLYGQNYFEITFDGESVLPETVIIENLTQGTDVEMTGTDVLHLILESHTVSQMEMDSKELAIFPNPMEQTCNIEFLNAKQGNVSIRLYSITGKQIQNYSNVFSKGNHSLTLTGVDAGSYLLSVQTETDLFSGQFVSVGQTKSEPTLIYNEKKSGTTTLELRNTKSNKSIVEMDFAIEDELRFTGIAAGFENDIIYDSPTDDQTIIFVFTELYECGEPFTDARDGAAYSTVLIGDQCWMAENLAYLPEITFEDVWGSHTEPQYAVYDYAPGSGTETVAGAKATENYSTYGVLYNWAAAMDGAESSEENPSGVQGVCPPGWHLPSDAEWVQLEIYLANNGHNYDGSTGYDSNPRSKIAKAKAATTHWESSSNTGAVGNNLQANNSSGFTALPGGFRYFYGYFDIIGYYGFWWSATELDATHAWYRGMRYDTSYVYRFNYYKELGFSVRCVRDN